MPVDPQDCRAPGLYCVNSATGEKRYDGNEGMGMTEIDTDIDWMACELIEQIPGKVSGRPIVRGTRIMPDPIVNSYDLGDSIEEIHEGFPALSIAQIRWLIDFAHAQRAASVVKCCSTMSRASNAHVSTNGLRALAGDRLTVHPTRGR
jgi:uncharacterized protein (DUF433 family)